MQCYLISCLSSTVLIAVSISKYSIHRVGNLVWRKYIVCSCIHSEICIILLNVGKMYLDFFREKNYLFSLNCHQRFTGNLKAIMYLYCTSQLKLRPPPPWGKAGERCEAMTFQSSSQCMEKCWDSDFLTSGVIAVVLTHISLASHFWDIGKHCNIADPEQTSQNAASDQGLHCLLMRISLKNKIKMKKVHQPPLELEMDLSNWSGWNSPIGK